MSKCKGKPKHSHLQNNEKTQKKQQEKSKEKYLNFLMFSRLEPIFTYDFSHFPLKIFPSIFILNSLFDFYWKIWSKFYHSVSIKY